MLFMAPEQVSRQDYGKVFFRRFWEGLIGNSLSISGVSALSCICWSVGLGTRSMMGK